MVNFDYQLFALINSWAGRFEILDLVGFFCAYYLIWLMIPTVFGLWFFYHNHQERFNHHLLVLKIVLGAGLVLAINYLVSLIYFRPRPFVNFEVTQLLEKSSLHKSFPSDHAALAFLIAGVVFFYHRKLGLVLLLVAVLVALGRIFVGVHYPGDILAGLLVGFLVAMAIEIVEKRKIKWLSKGLGNFFAFRWKK